MPIKKIVTHTVKDADGDITAVGNLKGDWFVRLPEAIRQIERGTHEYYSQNITRNCLARSKIEVMNIHSKGKFLRTIKDGISLNNLDNLPELD